MQDITADQVNSFHSLVGFLRKLRVIGVIKAKTVRSNNMTHTKYSLIFESYDASMKGRMLPHEELERFFARQFEENDYTYSELQDLCHRRDSDEM